jgi:DeoR family glycerol-3-phosphate regulon repressor
MTSTGRREHILQLLRSRGYLAIDDLVAHFKVTPQTLRGDLNHLAHEGRLIRHHGGASIPSSVANSAYALRRSEFAHEKSLLGQALADWLPDNISLFLTPGTTTLAVAQALHIRKGLKVITNHLEAAQMLVSYADTEVVVLGGHLHGRNFSCSGTSTLAAVEAYRTDAVVFSVGGIDAEGSLLEYHESEADVARRMLQRAASRVLVVHHTKFGRAASVRLGSITDVNVIISDQPLPPPVRRLLQGRPVHLVVARG